MIDKSTPVDTVFELIVENDLLTHEQIRFYLLKDYDVLIPREYISDGKK